MNPISWPRIPLLFLLATITLLVVSACNLTSAPEEQIDLTDLPTTTITVAPTRTLSSTRTAPTPLPLTTRQFATARPGQLPPTSVVVVPPQIVPTSTQSPIRIAILSPIPGNVVAGNVQVLGAAIHPSFLQYQLEYGPDPNPSNLWYPASGVVQAPVLNGLLGIWSTNATPDGNYQLRLRVILRDGTTLATVVNNIRVQNTAPTPIPSATPGIPRPIAAFTQDRARGQAPLVVRFVNQSTGNINNYSWNFGDGSTSPEANPTHTFRNPGVYTVTLTVAGPGGRSNVSRQINVQSATPPVAAFTQDRTSGPSPLTVQFTDQSTGQIRSYEWNFGDGTTSGERNPRHTFTNVGTYNVILTITGPGGSSSVTRQITVENTSVPAPRANFGANPTSGNVPLTVQFTNQSTGNITAYTWEFGDGATSTDVSPTHTYANPGTYNVRLIAVGPGGQSTAQATINATRPANAPVAAFTPSVTSGSIPLTVQFNNQSTGDITRYEWSFGDGSSTERNPSYTFTQPGTYTVRLTVTGPGGTSTAERTISATEPTVPTTAAFTQDVTSGEAPLTVQFTNQSSGENLTFSWNFGDGETSTEENPQHTFDQQGNYQVVLTVTGTGGQDTAEVAINVSETVVIAPPVAAFSANPSTGEAPLTVQFTNQSTGDITEYSWDFQNDGTVDSTEQNPSFSFTTAGNYTVSLTATGPGGDNTTTGQITVSAAPPPNQPPTINPINAQTVEAGQTLPVAISYSDPEGAAVTVQANSDNPAAATVTQSGQSELTITGVAEGTANISVTVTDDQGETASVSFQVVVTAAPVPNQPPTIDPIAGQTVEAGSTLPVAINYNDPEGAAVTLQADSDNPNIATVTQSGQSELTITGVAEGTANISVTVTDDQGETANTTFQVTITAAPVPNQPPTIDPIAPQVLDVGATLPVAFNYNDPEGGPVLVSPTSDNPGVVSVVQSAPNELTLTGVAAGTANITVALDDGQGGTNSASFSVTVNEAAIPAAKLPTGPVIMFVSNRDGNNEIYQMNPDGNNLFRTTDNGANDNSPAWSPDGSRIVFTTDRDGNNEIYVMDVDGNNPTNLTNNGANDNTPSWTANNNRIAFVSNRDGNNEIYVMDADGNNVTRITDNGANDSNPVWSPDGSRILFVSDRDGNNEIYVMDADGNNVTNLTNDAASDIDPTWRPDGQRIAFASDRDGNYELYKMDVNDLVPSPATDIDATNTEPNYRTSDGQRLAFVTDRDGNREIYLVNLDGSEVVRVTNDNADDTSPVWKP
jgi:PKD repeat protein